MSQKDGLKSERRGHLRGQSPAEILKALEDLADETGLACFRRAANAMMNARGGRPAIDDRAAIRQAKQLVSSGQAATMNAALRKVARSAGAANVKSFTERLRRKISAEAQK